MKGFFAVVLYLACFFCTSCQKTDTPYLSIAATYYDDQISPEHGMTTKILKKIPGKEGLEEVGNVSYTSQYPLAVYSANDNMIYYSAVDEGGKLDQLWQYHLDTGKAEKLTDSLFAINTIIPRENDIFLIATERGERRNAPFLYDKVTKTLSEIETGIDFHCDYCTYEPNSNRLIMTGTSYRELYQVIEAWNAREIQSEPYYPPDSYIYEISGKDAKLLFKTERFRVNGIAVKNDKELYFSGLRQESPNTPEEQYLLKTGQTPVEYPLFKEDFPITVYEFIFASENDVYGCGAGADAKKYPRGIYHYDIRKDKLELIYDGKECDAYINNFVFLKDSTKSAVASTEVRAEEVQKKIAPKTECLKENEKAQR